MADRAHLRVAEVAGLGGASACAGVGLLCVASLRAGDLLVRLLILTGVALMVGALLALTYLARRLLTDRRAAERARDEAVMAANRPVWIQAQILPDGRIALYADRPFVVAGAAAQAVPPDWPSC